jgi:hypothetical protein
VSEDIRIRCTEAHEVAESAAQRAAVSADLLVLGFRPGEEGFDQRAAVDVAQTFDLVGRLATRTKRASRTPPDLTAVAAGVALRILCALRGEFS